MSCRRRAWPSAQRRDSGVDSRVVEILGQAPEVSELGADPLDERAGGHGRVSSHLRIRAHLGRVELLRNDPDECRNF